MGMEMGEEGPRKSGDSVVGQGSSFHVAFLRMLCSRKFVGYVHINVYF